MTNGKNMLAKPTQYTLVNGAKKLKQKPKNIPIIQGIKLGLFKGKGAKAVELAREKNKTPEYWQTYHNFEVLLTYNRSPQYAMSV